MRSHTSGLEVDLDEDVVKFVIPEGEQRFITLNSFCTYENLPHESREGVGRVAPRDSDIYTTTVTLV